jgi:hypothetical protein
VRRSSDGNSDGHVVALRWRWAVVTRRGNGKSQEWHEREKDLGMMHRNFKWFKSLECDNRYK